MGQIAMACSSDATAPRGFAGRLDVQLLVASAIILDEGMPGDYDPGATVLLEPRHRPEPRLQPAVIRLDTVVAYWWPRCRAAASSSSGTIG
jgi:hypothetical protein